MKYSFLILSLALTFSAMAKDMAQTEKYDDAYKEMSDGTVAYVGKCSVHQDYTGAHFVEKAKLVEYFDLGYGQMTKAEFLKKTSALDVQLMNQMAEVLETELPVGIDDFSADKIESTKFKGLDLYRLSVGVGGGNGMFLIYNRTVKKGVVSYEYMAKVMDGDVEYCDSKVWLSK